MFERKLRRALIVVTPAVCLATVAIGLYVGARKVEVVGALAVTPRAEGARSWYWDLATSDESLGAPFPTRVERVTVHAEADGRVADWRGGTNADGAAVVHLDLDLPWGSAIRISAKDESTGALLLSGSVAWPPLSGKSEKTESWLRFAERTGELELNVVIVGGRLVADAASTVWVRATDRDGRPVTDASVTAESEEIVLESPGESRGFGWTSFRIRPLLHAASVTFRAAAMRGAWAGTRAGTWTGGLPIAPAAVSISVATVNPSDLNVELVSHSPKSIAYAQVIDSKGRAFASDVHFDQGKASLTVPALSPGLYWLVASTDFSNLESVTGTSAKPFLAGPSDRETVRKLAASCGSDAEIPALIEPCLALAPVPLIPRAVALDGKALQAASVDQRRRRGRSIALSAVGLSVILELVLLGAELMERRQNRRGRIASEKRGFALIFQAFQAAIGILLALLGFALIAALLMWAT